MRDWEGINLATAATAPGDEYASNTRIWIRGELRRRDGMSSFSAVSGTALTGYYTKLGDEYVVLSTSTGTLEAVLAV